MDMNTFRSDLHIAHQSRRDKLRVQNDHHSNPPHHHLGGVYINTMNLDHHHPGLNYDRRPGHGNICYDPSELLSFPPAMYPQKDGYQDDGKRSYDQNFSRNDVVVEEIDPSSTVMSSDPQYFSTWKSIGSQSSSDYSSIFVGNALSGSSMKIINSNPNPMSALDVKPAYLGYQELNSPLSNNPSTDPMNCSYQNALQDLVTSSNLGLEFASLRQKSCDETGHGSWVVGGSELLLLPGYTDQLRLNQWGGDHQMDFPAVKDGCNNREVVRRVQAVDNSNHTQALSLSLSSVPSPKTDKDSFQSRNVTAASDVDQDTRAWKKPGIPGPLGPFTGYATILTSSKFLRPAQQLLEECCCANSDIIKVHDATKSLEQLLRVSNDGVTNSEPSMKAMAGDSCSVSSLAFKDKNQDPGRSAATTSSSVDSHRPQNLHKKAKLLCMQDEVCKRYKQYHQQMQMVVSSFESVAGLSAATPYVSLALKMVAKHFRCLKSVITDQLRSIKNSLGEELSSPSCGGSKSSKGDASVSMLKFFDQNFQKQKGGGSLEGPHIWRPQRGLPERAVSILRAWLFEHFLHPYPTDTDKHMLASQTGLTRNQVSNWFINARVRVWKPMVEEIHMLETKGAVEAGAEGGAVEAGAEGGKTRVEGGEEMNESNQCMNRLRMNTMAEKQVECSSMSMSTSTSPSEHEVGRPNPTNIWSQDKRSRIEYHIPSSIDGSLMGLVPSHHGGIELAGGLSSVSLTLGLRQSAENGQRPPEHHLRPHFGHNIIRDFVG